jgi:hypothetical protein
MTSIDTRCFMLTGVLLRRQIQQACILPQPTEDHDSQICQRLQNRSSRIARPGQALIPIKNSRGFRTSAGASPGFVRCS